jgi:hypothetical protein
MGLQGVRSRIDMMLSLLWERVDYLAWVCDAGERMHRSKPRTPSECDLSAVVLTASDSLPSQWTGPSG